MSGFLPLLVGATCTGSVTFFVWNHIWVTLIYVVNVVVAALMYVGTYAFLMPSILEWNYQHLVLGNPTLV